MYCILLQLHIAYPASATQKVLKIEDERVIRAFVDKRISHEVEGDCLGDDWKGYIFKITGGNDLQGFPMKQGVLTSGRVRLLLKAGASCYRQRKRGERKRKSVRGCIVSADLSIINLIIVKKGDKDIEGLTDVSNPRRLGPKRASKIRKVFALTKEDDVRKFVVHRKIEKEGKMTYSKAPKIQRLITPARLQRKRKEKALVVKRYTKSKKEAEEYNTLLQQRKKEAATAKSAAIAKKRSLSRKLSEKKPVA